MDCTIRDIDTPLGRYTLAATAEGLTHVQLVGSPSLPQESHPLARVNASWVMGLAPASAMW